MKSVISSVNKLIAFLFLYQTNIFLIILTISHQFKKSSPQKYAVWTNFQLNNKQYVLCKPYWIEICEIEKSV